MLDKSLDEIREELGLTWTKFASEIGISRKTIYRLRNGESDIKRIHEMAINNLRTNNARHKNNNNV